MVRISLGEVWEESLQLLKREAGVIMPVALATFGLALLAFNLLAQANGATAGAAATSADLGTILIGLVLVVAAGLFGSLAIAALVLRPGLSVGEALSLARARFLSGLGALAIGAVILLLLLLAVSMALGPVVGTARLSASVAAGTLPGEVAVAVLILSLAILAATVRLTTLAAVLVERPLAPWAALRAAFRQTGPVFWRLLLCLIGVQLVLQIVVVAIELAAGAIALALGPMVQLAAAVLASGVGAVFSGFWSIFAARLYKRLASAPAD
jgi:hypothetical protein